MWSVISSWFSKVSIRFVAALLVLIVGFGVGILICFQAFTEDSYLIRKNELQHIVTLAKNAIEPIVEEKRQGLISSGEARLRVAEILNRFVYSDGVGPNFVFFASYEGYVLVDPFKPNTVGTYQMQRRDAEGNAITRELLQTAQAGGGFVFYSEARTEVGRDQKKLSFVTGIPELECYIGTGMYVDDIENSVNSLLIRILLLNGFVLAVSLGLQYHFLYPILHCFFTMACTLREFDCYRTNSSPVNSQLMVEETDLNQLIDNARAMMEALKVDRIALRERLAEVHRLAYCDALTNLPNRVSLRNWFMKEIEESTAEGSFGALMFLDLNNFKKVNDLFGHSSGDKLLMQIGMRIDGILPECGRVFRLGGDEFIIVIPGSDCEAAEIIAQNISQEIEYPYTFQEETFFVTGSLGIALYPQDGSDLDSLLSRADAAMYYAKEAKKNGYSRSEP